MDWSALHNNELWRSLWESEEIGKRVGEIERQLQETPITDAHTLGKMRGQLEVYRKLPEMVRVYAEVQDRGRSIASEPDEQPTGGWSFRRFRIR